MTEVNGIDDKGCTGHGVPASEDTWDISGEGLGINLHSAITQASDLSQTL